MNKEFNIILCRLSAVFVLYIAELGENISIKIAEFRPIVYLTFFVLHLLMTNCHRTLFNSSIWFLYTFHLFSRFNIEDFKNEFNNVIYQ